MRIPNSEHRALNWRIDEVAPDFRLEDVWALPAEGRREDFDRLLKVLGSLDLSGAGSRAAGALMWIRLRAGAMLGWDDPAEELQIPGEIETSLSARLPDDLRDSATGLEIFGKGFKPLYRTDLESAAELSNRTVHAIVQLAWVKQGDARYRGRMAIYVKPRGALGDAYMALIAPFRHLVVYPALLRAIGRAFSGYGTSGAATANTM